MVQGDWQCPGGRWDAGLFPSPAQWARDPVLPQLRLRS